MSDAHEQSYYEIALTNRQVLAAFVIVLSCVLTAFFAGVWVGRGAPRAEAVGEAPPETERMADADFEDPKEFEFFADKEGKVPEKRPDMREIAESPDPDTTLAQDLGVEPKPPQEKAAPPVRPTEEPAKTPEAAEQAPAEPRSPPSEAAAGDETFVIQVFSTRDEIQARKQVTRLQEAGFEAFLSPLESDRVTMYRVRVGPFRDRSRAEAVAGRIRDQLKLDTWITSP